MIDFTDLQVKIVQEEGNEGTYEITPLPRGYGHTLANTMRRILLSSLEGATITSVRIAGIEHEYSTIPGMKEDVVELILNLKSLKFSSTSDDPQIMILDINGKKEVTAADIQLTGGVELADTSVHLATLTAGDAHLSVEIVVEKGVGYKPAEEEGRSEMGRIPLDADFSPIKKVSIDVINARKGQETDLDGIMITVLTDGSIKPIDALLNSSKILQEFAGKVMAAMGIPVSEVELAAEEARKIEEKEEAESDSVSEEVLAWRIEDLPISKRSKTGLLSGGFETIGDLSGASSTDLLNLSGFGNKSLSEVLDLLSQYNIELKS